MKRKMTFDAIDKSGNIKTITVFNKADLLKVVSDIKKFGGQVYLKTLKVSDTIQIGDTFIFKNGGKK